MSAIDPVRLPPLHPLTTGAKMAVSCHKPFDWLIRAWAPAHGGNERLVEWILHHVGRMNSEGLEWWGFTYGGQPPYMGTRDLSSGLTIQRYVEPPDRWTKAAVDEGRIGPCYGPPTPLEIPEQGVVLAPILTQGVLL